MSEPIVVHEQDVERTTWSDPVRGEVGFRTIVGGAIAPGELTAGLADLEAGGWLGHHRHEPAEIYYVLQGSGTLSIDGRDHVVGAGSAAYIPGGAEHAIRNTGEGPLRFFYAFAVGSADQIEYRFTAAD